MFLRATEFGRVFHARKVAPSGATSPPDPLSKKEGEPDEASAGLGAEFKAAEVCRWAVMVARTAGRWCRTWWLLKRSSR